MTNHIRSVGLLLVVDLVTMSIVGLPALAQCDPPSLVRLLPSDGAADDRFGHAVAIFGGMAIVGAYQDDDNGPDSGSAYVYDALTGQQLFKLLADDGVAYDFFGSAVATDGRLAVVGAYGRADYGEYSGAAYVFDLSTGAQVLKLLPNDVQAGDFFGTSVSISGNLVIISANGRDDNGPESGAAYLFDVSSGEQLAKLLPSDGEDRDYFGRSVTISGRKVVVGAYLDDDNGSGSGSAYLFDVSDPESPVEVAKLIPDDNAEGDWFGVSAAMSGSTVIIGAHLHDDNGSESGAAYLFDAGSGEQIAKLLAADGAPYDMFGWSVGIDGDRAIVGAFGRSERGGRSGAAYVFDRTTGNQIAKLLAPDGREYDQFGYSVSISESIAIAGAKYDDNNGPESGSAYVFDTNDLRLGLWWVGSCPGDALFRVTGVTPGAEGAIVLAFSRGAFQIPPGHPCSGAFLCLDATLRVVRRGAADGSGFATFGARVDPQYCGRIHLQAIDFSNCATSNVILIE